MLTLKVTVDPLFTHIHSWGFGVLGENGLQQSSLNWILLNPNFQGMGIGSAIMNRISALAHQVGARLVEIAPSHKSALFFVNFGAVEIAAMENGWGPGIA